MQITSRNAERQEESGAVADSTLVNPEPAVQHFLTRGLQIPSRTRFPTTGFARPKILEYAGISKQEWKAFTHEVKHSANLRISQCMAVAGMGCLMGVFLPFGPLVACIVCQKAWRHLELENIIAAGGSGALEACAKRWNDKTFQSRGLLVRIDVPYQQKDMKQMDVSSSSLYQYHQMTDFPSLPRDTPGTSASRARWVTKELGYQTKESKTRLKAARKARIVIVPIDYAHPNA